MFLLQMPDFPHSMKLKHFLHPDLQAIKIINKYYNRFI